MTNQTTTTLAEVIQAFSNFYWDSKSNNLRFDNESNGSNDAKLFSDFSSEDLETWLTNKNNYMENVYIAMYFDEKKIEVTDLYGDCHNFDIENYNTALDYFNNSLQALDDLVNEK